MADEQKDPELTAIATVLDALSPLDESARMNVIQYVFKRLNIPVMAAERAQPLRSMQDIQVSATPRTASRMVDVRSFAEEKQPKTSNEKVATIAYHLAYHAPEPRDFITADDVTKYFHQANLELPGSAPMALVHAKNAGYLDQQERGQYRLNPVGYNLVAHKLPSSAGAGKPKGRGRTRKPKRAKSRRK
jgi:hypothetical protein